MNANLAFVDQRTGGCWARYDEQLEKGKRGRIEGVNLAKAVIKLISYLEDARMYRADRESGRALCLSLARSLVFSLTVLIIRDSPPLLLFAPPRPASRPVSLSRSRPRPSSGYLLGFYLWRRSQCSRPIWTGARSNSPIIIGRPGRTKLLPVGRTAGGGRDGFRERSKALRVIRSGIIFRRVLFQFINKDS